MRKILFLFIFLPLISAAQTTVQNDVSVLSTNVTTNWVEIYQQDGVIFYVKKTVCGISNDINSQEMILFKLENTTDRMFVIDWDVTQLLSDPISGVQNTKESSINVFLSAGEIVEGVCNVESDYFALLTIFGRFVNQADKPQLTQFSLSNIKFSVHE